MIPAKSEVLFKKISHLFELDRNKVESLFSPYFVHYHRGYFSGDWDIQRQVEYFYDVFKRTKADKARVLDIGCGFGLMSVFFADFGAAEIVSIDANTEKIRGFNSLLKWLGMENGSVRVELGDALSLGFPDEEFEVIIANDVLSHVRDLDGFLEEARRLLKPKGRFYIYDNINKLFFPNFFKFRKFWKKVEKGPLDDIAFRGTDERLSFAELRRRMILEIEPDCDALKLKYLVRKTAGMYGEEIKSSVYKFRQKGKIKNPRPFKYRNPKTGEYPERPINALMISKALRRKGFLCRVLPVFYFIKSTGIKGSMKKGLGLISRKIPSVSLVMTPSFRLLCFKRKP
jgi:ubiquinone/menaquinone biosynthesis C-methylase UbiE